MTNPKQNRRARKKGLRKTKRKKRRDSISNSTPRTKDKQGHLMKTTGTQSFMEGVLASSGFKQTKKNKKQCNR